MTPQRLISAARVGIAAVVITFPCGVRAQVYNGTGNIHEVFADSELETYLRYLDLTDTTSYESWSIRPFSPLQLRQFARDVPGSPWAARLTSFKPREGAFRIGLLSPQTGARFNSTFPYGSNDGAIWAGRGLTSSVAAGVYADAGPLSVTIFPTVFRAENTAFPLFPSPLACGCGDALFSNVVDRPQRFGTSAYHQLDPGQTTIRLDLLGFSAGGTTANEAWGPMAEYPFLLGNNAPGFPHIFLGTSHPLPILVGRAQIKIIYGRLDQSQYSPITGSKYYFSGKEPGRVRFASGLIATFQPRFFDGLEIGGARFIHSIWPRTGLPSSYLRKPLQAFLKANLPGIDQNLARTDNQLASFFARWAFKPSGLEIYGEYGREDNSYDLRDFMQEPDHSRAYSIGLAKVFRSKASRFDVLRAEIMNFQLPVLAATQRGEGGIYWHSILLQGHTNRGQLLGADVGVGEAAGSTFRWDRYSTGGRWAVFYRRDLRAESSDQIVRNPEIIQLPDVLHAIGYERMKFTRRFDITGAVTVMRDQSRNFDGSKMNLNLTFALTLPRQR